MNDFSVVFTKKAEKDLAKFNLKIIHAIFTRLQKLHFPFPQNFDIKKMVNAQKIYRLRVGKIL